VQATGLFVCTTLRHILYRIRRICTGRTVVTRLASAGGQGKPCPYKWLLRRAPLHHPSTGFGTTPALCGRRLGVSC
jgi:hypothetical protein